MRRGFVGMAIALAVLSGCAPAAQPEAITMEVDQSALSTSAGKVYLGANVAQDMNMDDVFLKVLDYAEANSIPITDSAPMADANYDTGARVSKYTFADGSVLVLHSQTIGGQQGLALKGIEVLK